MTPRRILLSRFFIVPAVIILTIVGWNLYVDEHAHGQLGGRVVDAAGKPVADATVILSVHDFVTQVEKARTRTDAAGQFQFTHNNSHLIQLQAQTSGVASTPVKVRLWFRGQDHVVAEPLRVPGGA